MSTTIYVRKSHDDGNRPVWVDGDDELRGIFRQGRWRYRAWRQKVKRGPTVWLHDVTLDAAIRWAFGGGK